MDFSVLLAIAVACCAALTAGVLFFRRSAIWAVPADSFKRSLPVVPTHSCETCAHWNLEAGQHLMQSHSAFFAATAHLQPWQMAAKREVVWNEEYIETEQALQEALKTKDVEAQRTLHEKLLTLNPGELVDPETYVNPDVLRSKWSDLGACTAHQELRMRQDVCSKWKR